MAMWRVLLMLTLTVKRLHVTAQVHALLLDLSVTSSATNRSNSSIWTECTEGGGATSKSSDLRSVHVSCSDHCSIQ